jgi:hypothetical protein
MIKLRQPALVLHSCDVKGYKFKMWASWNMPARMRPRDVVYWILHARDHTPELILHNVLINTHGRSGELYIGGKDVTEGLVDQTLNIHNVDLFSQLRGKDIGTIWLHGCNVADPSWGPRFCASMAMESGCNVVAAESQQKIGRWDSCPFGCFDDYEGRTSCWDASGKRSIVFKNGAGAPGVA